MLGQQLAHTAETMPAVPISILIYTQHGGFLLRESTNIDQYLSHEKIFRPSEVFGPTFCESFQMQEGRIFI